MHARIIAWKTGLKKLMIGLREKFRRTPSTSRRSPKNPTPLNTYLTDMAIRKVWVKRANASATQVAIGPDDLVDDVRDAVIRKYLNSLGRTFDAPDVLLKICPREQANIAGKERSLAPDEPIIRLIDAYYPGGQTVEEALVIDVPQRRTPRPSPRPGPHMPSYYIPEEIRPGEAGEYFPPMPALHSPRINAHSALTTAHPANSHLNSMAIITTGQVPALPSPGGRSARHRPKAGRQQTSSPTVIHSLQTNSNNLIGMTIFG
jgi:osomolarity two-component system, response regulator SSK1